MRGVLLILFCCVSTVVHPAEPYDFRGARLGMTLSEFKSMPYPDPKPSESADLPIPAPVCTGDPYLGSLEILLQPRGTQASLGMVTCIWATRKSSATTSRVDYIPAAINVAGAQVSLVRYAFVKLNNEGELRLYRIGMSGFASARFERIFEGLRERFGPPSSVDQSMVQNRMGAQFPNTTATWRNDQSVILVVQRATAIDEMSLSYRHQVLSAYVERENKKLEGKPSDKL